MSVTVNVDELFVSWLRAQMSDVGVSSERPADIEKRLPFVVVRRGGGGTELGVDRPVIDADFYADTVTAVADLGRRVQRLFMESTPTLWRGCSISWLSCNQGVTKVGDVNQGVRHAVSVNIFSLS